MAAIAIWSYREMLDRYWVFFTCFLLADSRYRAIIVLSGSGVVACFVPWVVYHSRFITGAHATWIGKLSVAASIHWFEHLAFGEMASVLVFIGAATAVLATGGGRRAVALNSTIGTCALVSLLTLVAAAASSLHTHHPQPSLEIAPINSMPKVSLCAGH